jgi:hypothetical protein
MLVMKQSGIQTCFYSNLCNCSAKDNGMWCVRWCTEDQAESGRKGQIMPRKSELFSHCLQFTQIRLTFEFNIKVIQGLVHKLCQWLSNYIKFSYKSSFNYQQCRPSLPTHFRHQIIVIHFQCLTLCYRRHLERKLTSDEAFNQHTVSEFIMFPWH